MRREIVFSLNKATKENIFDHLLHCNYEFIPPLSYRLDIKNYSCKIFENADLFEAWVDGVLIGLVAAYCDNNINKASYITNVSVFKEWRGGGVATNLLDHCIEYVKNKRFEQVVLEVHESNTVAIKLYEKKGFDIKDVVDRINTMNLYIKGYK